MRFSLVAVSFLVSLAIAAPVPEPHHTEKQIAAKGGAGNAQAAGGAAPVASAAAPAKKAKGTKASKSKAAAAAAPAAATSAAASSATAPAAKKAKGTKASKSTAAAAAPAAATSAAASSAAASTGSKAAAAAGGSVLTAAAYNDFQISTGTAGGAQAKANALFSKIDQTNLAGVSASDLKIIQGVHDAAENAEVQAFNPAIAAASGAAATALQNGKIQNKVLKLTAEVLGIQVKAAQGGSSADLAAEQAKLANNIKLDTAAAGQASTAVPFAATS